MQCLDTSGIYCTCLEREGWERSITFQTDQSDVFITNAATVQHFLLFVTTKSRPYLLSASWLVRLYFDLLQNKPDGRFSWWICEIQDLKSDHSSCFARLVLLDFIWLIKVNLQKIWCWTKGFILIFRETTRGPVSHPYMKLSPVQLFGRRSLYHFEAANHVPRRSDLNANTVEYTTPRHTAGPVMLISTFTLISHRKSLVQFYFLLLQKVKSHHRCRPEKPGNSHPHLWIIAPCNWLCSTCSSKSQHAAARNLPGTGKREHITPSFMLSLYYLIFFFFLFNIYTSYTVDLLTTTTSPEVLKCSPSEGVLIKTK